MARRATKDTFAFERVGIAPGDESEVRRQVIAGQLVPDHYRVEDGSAVEETDGPPGVGLGAAPQSYKHQLDENGRLREEHVEATRKVSEANEEAAHAAAAGSVGAVGSGGSKSRSKSAAKSEGDSE